MGDQWFAQNYYAVLASNGDYNVAKNEEGQTCGHATVSLSRTLCNDISGHFMLFDNRRVLYMADSMLSNGNTHIMSFNNLLV